MSFISHLSPYLWLLFSMAVSIAVLRELRRPSQERRSSSERE